MGRAMLIICTGMLVILGIIGISTADQGKSLTQKAVKYANETTAQNAAHTAIQIAMQKVNEDDSWATTYDKSNTWTQTIDEATVELYVETNSDYSTNGYWEEDSLRITSKATYADGYESEVVSVYLKEPFSNLVPKFKGALSLALMKEEIKSLSIGGSSIINGNPPSGSGCSNMPGIAAMDESYADELEASGTVPDWSENKGVTGDPQLKYDSDLKYSPVDEMIARLKKSGNSKTISGQYSGSLGTQENPGVFFVEDYVKLTGKQDAGYGILVIRGDGGMGYEGELDLKGNFEFNGLVVFENAELFDGKGTPTINGSVLVGKRPQEESSTYENSIDIDISGNISIQYNCIAEKYAKMAAADAVKQNKYTRVVTYE
ncbi:hypothetical protein LQ318_06960 [Aliifodinibius salicampi]|uniref:PilX N-terminal n=1 Tax=Fodinibius salicampi TaxID=1920655 RepID=A0ABT3PXP6_9BACT|nr:hypothetical protein [Fodinibius salicampi]MCW9712639.1 hypothetical protein [Fodinibius salicampi]